MRVLSLLMMALCLFVLSGCLVFPRSNDRMISIYNANVQMAIEPRTGSTEGGEWVKIYLARLNPTVFTFELRAIYFAETLSTEYKRDPSESDILWVKTPAFGVAKVVTVTLHGNQSGERVEVTDAFEFVSPSELQQQLSTSEGAKTSPLPNDGGGTSNHNPPILTSISTPSAPLTGGVSILASGSDFLSGAVVSVGGVLCLSTIYISTTELSCTIPSGSAGSVSVTVTNPDGQSSTLVGIFTYIDDGEPTGAEPPPDYTCVNPPENLFDYLTSPNSISTFFTTFDIGVIQNNTPLQFRWGDASPDGDDNDLVMNLVSPASNRTRFLNYEQMGYKIVEINSVGSDSRVEEAVKFTWWFSANMKQERILWNNQRSTDNSNPDNPYGRMLYFSNPCIPVCGNSIVDSGETCDDGNNSNDDGCTNVCMPPFCGDGVLVAGEECDAGKNNSDAPMGNIWCSLDCKIRRL